MVLSPLRVELFGAPRIFFGDKAVRLEGPPGTLRLLAFLLLAPPGPIDRAIVATSLWPDSPDNIARTNLRRHIAYLDHAFRVIGCGLSVGRAGSGIELVPRDAIVTDVEEFADAAIAGKLEEALARYHGELLAGFADEWIDRERSHMQRRRIEVLTARVEQLQTQGDIERALYWALELRRAEPWNEEHLRSVMRLHRDAGDRLGALQEYRDFCDAVTAVFDAKPSPETQSLYEDLVREGEQLKQVGVLPAELTSFFGREADVESLVAALGEHRLVTLLGPPGVGKTRLATRIGRHLQERFPDGVWFVELASLDDPALVEQRIIDTLDRRRPQREQQNDLEARLANKNALLILDNAEHLLNAIAERAATLLRVLPDLRILVTSRAPLSVDGEGVHRVRPLELPARGANAEEIASYPAVQLFLDRAAAVSGNASVGDLPVADIADICRRLDGVPLAIEFAAARVRGMTIRQIKAGLDSRFQLLGQERHTATIQHRTLFGAFEWSYRLLNDDERRLFRALSVFRGGWTIESAAMVAEHDANIFDCLTTLVDNSLVTPSPPQSAEARYDFLESTRAFAGEQLRTLPEEYESVLSRHAMHFANRFIAKDEELRRARAHQYFAEIDREHDNVRAALAYLIGDRHDVVLGTRLALAISRYWFDRGYSAEGAHWLESALEDSNVNGNLRAQSLLCLATITRNAGDYEQAYQQFAESLVLLRDAGDRYDVIKALLQLSNVARMLSHFDEATAHAREALALCELAADEYFGAFARATLGCIELAAGSISEARDHFSLALAVFDDKGAGGDAALVVNNLGLCALYDGSTETASALCHQALERSRLARYDFSIAHSLHSLSVVSTRGGQVRDACVFLERALGLVETLADRELSLMCLEAAAEIALILDEPERAATLVAAAERGRRHYHALRAPIEERLIEELKDRIKSNIGEVSYEPLRALGSVLSLDDALEQVRALLASTRRSPSLGLA